MHPNFRKALDRCNGIMAYCTGLPMNAENSADWQEGWWSVAMKVAAAINIETREESCASGEKYPQSQ